MFPFKTCFLFFVCLFYRIFAWKLESLSLVHRRILVVRCQTNWTILQFPIKVSTQRVSPVLVGPSQPSILLYAFIWIICLSFVSSLWGFIVFQVSFCEASIPCLLFFSFLSPYAVASLMGSVMYTNTTKTHTHTHRREARGQSPNVESSLTPITRSVTFFSLSLPPVGSSVWSLLQQHTRTRDKNKTWNWAITNIFLMFVCFVKLSLGIFLLLLLLLPLICQRLQKYKSSAPDNK